MTQELTLAQLLQCIATLVEQIQALQLIAGYTMTQIHCLAVPMC